MWTIRDAPVKLPSVTSFLERVVYSDKQHRRRRHADFEHTSHFGKGNIRLGLAKRLEWLLYDSFVLYDHGQGYHCLVDLQPFQTCAVPK